MKEIKIKSMKFVNFKGLRDFEIKFNEDITRVFGRNGSGKTTIFDGFTWLLFGKDSDDRQSFNIKTLDSTGEAIPQLSHEVSAVISVNGEDITLRRTYVEKWVKRRGTVSAEFTGHTEERFYNDVPCTLKEYNEKIAELCSEQVFKFITNPTYFSRQKVDVQRAMLIRMVGGISDEDIAADNDDFAALLAQLTGKTLQEYKREVAAKKSKLKAEIETLPDRIEERQRVINELEPEDWQALKEQLAQLEAQAAELDASIADRAKARRVANDARLAIVKELDDVRHEIARRELEIKSDALKDWYEQKNKKQAALSDINSTDNEILLEQRRETQIAQQLLKLTREREVLVQEFYAIKKETLDINENEFVCPTCHRRYEVTEIESKVDELTAAFNARRAQRLDENKRNGLQLRSQIDELTAQRAQVQQRIAELKAKLDELTSLPIVSQSFDVEPSAQAAIESDSKWQELRERERELQRQSEIAQQPQEQTSLQEKRGELSKAMSDINLRLMKKSIIERNVARRQELEEQLRTQNAELARLEGIEYTIAEFAKARINAVEQRINSMFKIVRFKMFSKQVNGGEVETCEATVNGVPYNNGLNSAMRIIAGLDIINAICKFEGVTAPIFIDNAESVNDIPDTVSQLVALVVSDDAQLTVK